MSPNVQVARNTQDQDLSSGGRMVATDGRTLPLQGASLRADARAGVARVVLEQRFANPYDEPLHVTYLMPLPADGAVSGYAFRIGDRRVVGEVDRKAAARERFEQAIVEGRSAALLVEQRSNLFTQEIGNIPPRTEVVAELTIDQRLVWLDEGAWEWRFPTAAAPRFQGGPGRVPDAAEITVEVADKELPVRVQLGLVIRDALAGAKEAARPSSPSHSLHTIVANGSVEVALAAEKGAALDRDIVVRWPVATPSVGLTIDVARPAAGREISASSFGLLTVVPPTLDRRGRPVARDLIFLIDTSGSMDGLPLDQARRVMGVMVDTLGDDDQLEMIEFSNAPRRWKTGALKATAANRRDAQQWIAALRAGGSTEMKSGILEAMRPLRADSQRQIVLITDGLIGFETEVVAAIAGDLPRGSRLHTVGVGSSVNRSLTGPAARAGKGLEVVIGLGEDAERAAERMRRRTTTPLVVELEVSGSAVVGCSPSRLPDLFAGSPVLIGLQLRPEGGELRLRGRTADGVWEQRLTLPRVEAGTGSPAVAALFARESVEDLEMRLAAGANRGEVDASIERIGIDHQISTRLTSWVAVSQEVTVDPQSPTRKARMPQQLPHGMSAEGLGLRAAAPLAPQGRAVMAAPSTGTFHATFSLDESEGNHPVLAGASFGAPPSGSPPSMKAGAPPAPPQAQRSADAPEKPKLLDRVRGFFAGKPGPADDKKEKQEREESLASRSLTRTGSVISMPDRHLRARVVVAKSGELVLEITVDATLIWLPPTEATIVWSDGRAETLQLDVQRGTRATQLEAGQTFRVALRLPAGVTPGAFTSIRLVTPAGLIVLEP